MNLLIFKYSKITLLFESFNYSLKLYLNATFFMISNKNSFINNHFSFFFI
jgi:hypothetical protein